MTKILTPLERINNDAIYNKYWTVVKNMTVYEFHNALMKYSQELREHYDFSEWRKGTCFSDCKFALANLFLDHENISVTRYKRLFA